MERGIRIQEEIDEDTGVVCSGDNNDGDHVNEEKRRQEKEGDNKNNDDNNIRNRMESLTHGIILGQTSEEDEHRVIAPNKAKILP